MTICSFLILLFWQSTLEEEYPSLGAYHLPAIKTKLSKSLLPCFWLNGKALRPGWIKEVDGAFITLGSVEAKLTVFPLVLVHNDLPYKRTQE
jgi:hypothetical protein